jgi:broad specificity phosphatase PhoE
MISIMTNRRGFIRLLVAASLVTATAAPSWGQARATTVIVVRHAEKEAQPANDPPLTEAGRARARALWDALKDAGVSAVITTQYARTKQTAQPTVEALHLTPEIVAAAGATHAADVAAAVKRHPGQTVLVVGHSNTVPGIIAALGANPPAPICDAVYDNLYVVTIAESGKPSVVLGRYGAPSPVDSGCASAK